MPAVDWAAMPPQDVWDSLKSRPKKIAGPWTSDTDQIFGQHAFVRYDTDGHAVAIDRGGGDVTTLLRPGLLGTREAADSELRAADWLLVE